MPRRNRHTQRRPRRMVVEPVASRMTTDQMAHALIERGLASHQILDRGRRATEDVRNGNHDNEDEQ